MPTRKRPVSTDPEMIRRRVRRGGKFLKQDIAMLADAYGGGKPLEEWDDQELAHGRPRDVGGGYRGRPPIHIAPAVAAEARRRFTDGQYSKMRGYLGHAIMVVAKIMMDQNEDSRVRLDAAKFVIEHVLGKATTKVEIDASKDVRAMLASALVMPDGSPAHPVIDGQFLGEPDE